MKALVFIFMKKLEFLKHIQCLLKNTQKESLELSMKDVHHKGLFSLVIGGNEFGKLTRVFIADESIKPFEVQLHSHRYPIRLTVLKGNVRHYSAVEKQNIDCDTISLSKFEYKSPLNGGDGLSYLKEVNVRLKDYTIPVGSSLEMTAHEIHSVSCKKGSIWIVEEKGFETESSIVLGAPFITEELYNQALPFQINDKHQIVKKEVTKLILDYESI